MLAYNRLVTSELLFYVQNLKSLKLIGDEENIDQFSKELWKAR